MKKLLVLAAMMLFFIGCEKDFTNTVDPEIAKGTADSTSFPFNISTFTYIPDRVAIQDTLTYSVGIGNATETIKFFEIVLTRIDNTAQVQKFYLFDNGIDGDVVANDAKFSGKIPFLFADSNKSYSFAIKAYNQNNAVYAITKKNILVLPNHAPVLGAIVTAPDTVLVTTTTSLTLAIKASDPDGLVDIASVYYKVIRPNGTTNGLEFSMSDDGKAPDTKAADSVYTAGLVVNETNTKGTYTFNFFARDRMGVISNQVTHKMTIR